MSNGYFGIPTLKYLLLKKNKIKINYIITSKKEYINNKINIIKKIAKKNKIKIIFSEYLEYKKNIKKIKKSKPDLQILISFKIIKKKIWEIPSKGTINIHPSLLPKYKGPCPINWVIINGEKETGLTSFFVNDKIDNGAIILQKKIKIKKKTNFEKLYNKLSKLTVKFLKNTIKKIYKKNIKIKYLKNKNNIIYAPKINNYYSKIYLNYNKKKIYQLILGLSQDKPAWCFLNTYNNIYILNIYKINININIYKYINKIKISIGQLIYYKKKIFVKIKNDFIELLICQLNNKKIMNILDIYNGLIFKKNIFLF